MRPGPSVAAAVVRAVWVTGRAVATRSGGGLAARLDDVPGEVVAVEVVGEVVAGGLPRRVLGEGVERLAVGGDLLAAVRSLDHAELAGGRGPGWRAAVECERLPERGARAAAADDLAAGLHIGAVEGLAAVIDEHASDAGELPHGHRLGAG